MPGRRDNLSAAMIERECWNVLDKCIQRLESPLWQTASAHGSEVARVLDSIICKVITVCVEYKKSMTIPVAVKFEKARPYNQPYNQGDSSHYPTGGALALHGAAWKRLPGFHLTCAGKRSNLMLPLVAVPS